MKKIISTILILGTTSPDLTAQSDPHPPKTYKNDRNDISWTFYFDNDLTGGTDRYYTNGFRFAHLSEDMEKRELPKLHQILASPFPDVFVDKDAAYNVGYSFGQSLFTPSDTETEDLLPNDRPYAAWLYFSTSVHAKTQHRLDLFDLSIGVIGPLAGGEEVQNSIHELLAEDKAQGWDNQLENRLAVNAFYQKKWRQKYDISNSDTGSPWQVSLHQNLGASLGTVYTGLNGGASFRLGKHLPDDFGTNRISPTAYVQPVPFTSENMEYRGWGWYVFAGVEFQYLAHNVFLDGGVFENESFVDKKDFTAEVELGLAITKGSWRVAYTHVIRSKEFDGQLDNQQDFGTLALSYRF